MQVTPIETVYKGYHFRSRLEARWAVFFDELDFPYLYELEGFQLETTKYLPDFWLPNGIRFLNEVETYKDVWVEIKPTTELSDSERKKIAEFVKQTGKKILLIAGEPDVEANIRLISCDSNKKLLAQEVKWIELSDHSLGLIPLTTLNQETGNETRMALSHLTKTDRLVAAFAAAKQARFNGREQHQAASGVGVKKTCESCGTTFLASNPYHQLCYSCYKAKLESNSTAQALVPSAPLPKQEALHEQPALTGNFKRWSKKNLIGIGTVILLLLVGLTGLTLRNRDMDVDPTPSSTLELRSPSVTITPIARSSRVVPSPTVDSQNTDQIFSEAVAPEDGLCDCTENRYNCRDFSSSSAAQACFDYCLPISGDIHFLDSDGDKRVCEMTTP